MKSRLAVLSILLQIVLSVHSDNWAVIVDTSRFWFNYRHAANALSVYRSVKRMGIPDSHIILMLADDFACNPRNSYPGKIWNNRQHGIDVYGEEVEVDYRGEDVTVHNVIRVLTDRVEPGTPSSKRLDTTKDSNILVYMTGHGGEDFLKFQEQEELTSNDLADALQQMHLAKRYNEIMLIVDTCQAATLFTKIYSPNIIAISSSLKGEDSLSHHADRETGVYVIDRYTYHLLEFLERVPKSKTVKTVGRDLFRVCPKSQCISTANHKTFQMSRNVDQIPVTDFFSGVRVLNKIPPRTKRLADNTKITKRFKVESTVLLDDSGSFQLPENSRVELGSLENFTQSSYTIELAAFLVTIALYLLKFTKQ